MIQFGPLPIGPGYFVAAAQVGELAHPTYGFNLLCYVSTYPGFNVSCAALIRGELEIGGKLIDMSDYPSDVPIWALGGSRDKIAPPLQATGHMDLIDTVPVEHKLNLICNGGHMGLFRSEKILETHYSRIAQFIADRSDRVLTA